MLRSTLHKAVYINVLLQIKIKWLVAISQKTNKKTKRKDFWVSSYPFSPFNLRPLIVVMLYDLLRLDFIVWFIFPSITWVSFGIYLFIFLIRKWQFYGFKKSRTTIWLELFLKNKMASSPLRSVTANLPPYPKESFLFFSFCSNFQGSIAFHWFLLSQNSPFTLLCPLGQSGMRRGWRLSEPGDLILFPPPVLPICCSGPWQLIQDSWP